MKSIRNRLLLWLLLGIACFWLIGTTGFLYSYRSSLLADLETELMTLSRQVRMNQMQADRPTGNGTARPHHGGGNAYAERDFEDIYWQVWWEEEPEQPVASENLIGNLPRLYPEYGENPTRIVALESGSRVMVVGGIYGMGGHASEISVARDLENVNRALLKAFGLASGIGGFFAVLATLWVYYSLRIGLAPLAAIVDQVGTVEPIP